MAGETNPHNGTVGQNDPSRTLHVQHESVDRVIDPQQFQVSFRQDTGVDRTAGVIGPQLAAIDPADNVTTGQFRAELTEIDRNVIVRQPINRVGVSVVLLARTAQFRFEVTGEQPLRPGAAGNREGLKPCFEEGAGRGIVSPGDFCRSIAGRRPVGPCDDDGRF